MFDIYKITHIASGLVYIGQTRNGVEARWRSHQSPNAKSADMYICRAVAKHGPGAFTIEHIACATSLNDLNAFKALLIAQHDCRVPNGYNIGPGGGVSGDVHPITSAKMSEKKVAAMADPATRAKISSARKAQWVEKRAAMGAAISAGLLKRAEENDARDAVMVLPLLKEGWTHVDVVELTGCGLRAVRRIARAAAIPRRASTIVRANSAKISAAMKAGWADPVVKARRGAAISAGKLAANAAKRAAV